MVLLAKYCLGTQRSYFSNIKGHKLIRALDVLFSLFAMLAISPILLGTALWNVLTGEHQIFYRQTRVGEAGKPFEILKFATMVRDSPNMPGGGFVEHNDPRLLPLGAFLRKTKINELPQLINVLCGDMSLVGFRPLAQASFDTAISIGGVSVYKVLPGITSLASIVLRNEEEILADVSASERQHFYDTQILPQKVALDRWWQENRSIYNYLALICLTAMALVLPHQLLPLKLLTDPPLVALGHRVRRKRDV
jgi:lipopolysaccharide/colanic/teichoic acid biosynthesis glycosyltransferase